MKRKLLWRFRKGSEADPIKVKECGCKYYVYTGQVVRYCKEHVPPPPPPPEEQMLKEGQAPPPLKKEFVAPGQETIKMAKKLMEIPEFEDYLRELQGTLRKPNITALTALMQLEDDLKRIKMHHIMKQPHRTSSAQLGNAEICGRAARVLVSGKIVCVSDGETCLGFRDGCGG